METDKQQVNGQAPSNMPEIPGPVPFNLRKAHEEAVARAIANSERIPLTEKQQSKARAINAALAELDAVYKDKRRMMLQTLAIMMDTILEERGSKEGGQYELTPDGTALYLKEEGQGQQAQAGQALT